MSHYREIADAEFAARMEAEAAQRTHRTPHENRLRAITWSVTLAAFVLLSSAGAAGVGYVVGYVITKAIANIAHDAVQAEAGKWGDF